MKTMKTTNILLFMIFLVLLGILISRFPIGQAIAETLRLDTCITTDAYDKPAAYVHVVVHDVSPIQSPDKLR